MTDLVVMHDLHVLRYERRNEMSSAIAEGGGGGDRAANWSEGPIRRSFLRRAGLVLAEGYLGDIRWLSGTLVISTSSLFVAYET